MLKHHRLRVAYDNAKAEAPNADYTNNLERIVLGGERDMNLLPASEQSLLFREVTAAILLTIRDIHNVCPHHVDEDDEAECTCNHYDMAIDAMDISAPLDQLLPLFRDCKEISPLLAALNEMEHE